MTAQQQQHNATTVTTITPTFFCVALSMGCAGTATTPSTSTMDSLGMPHAYLTMVFDTVVSSANITASTVYVVVGEGGGEEVQNKNVGGGVGTGQVRLYLDAVASSADTTT
jgi:hypothetical protein